jgi:tetratricopeptide repeat protein
VYRPAPGQALIQRGPLLRRDTIGTFESRLRWKSRLRWLVPAGVLVLAALAAAAWLYLSNHKSPEAEQLQTEGLALLALDDAASLDAAAQRLDEANRVARRGRPAVADRALAQVLRAATLAEESEALSARASARSAERERLRRDMPPGWEAAEKAAASEVDALGADARARAEKARALREEALAALTPLEGAPGATGAQVPRALACYHALGGDPALVRRYVDAARAAAPDDAWAGLAEATLELRSKERASRERGAAALATIAARHPEMLRARYLLARTQADLGRRAEALAMLDGVLAANPHHEGAIGLRAELSRPPSAPAPRPGAAPTPVPAAGPVASPTASPAAGAAAGPDAGGAANAAPPTEGNGAALPRKPVAQPVIVSPSGPPAPAVKVPPPQTSAGAPRAAPPHRALTPAAAPVPAPRPVAPPPPPPPPAPEVDGG